jgi:hypothetical protein
VRNENRQGIQVDLISGFSLLSTLFFYFVRCPSNDSQAHLRHRELAGTVASFRTWRGSRCSLAQDPAISGGQLNPYYIYFSPLLIGGNSAKPPSPAHIV